ncbi:DUF2787 domain-containing protein [Shewanella sp. AS16]|uniref:DUF2787 family protein n=1 Tax=Shewanella sp. AS16 TaxID=2907625 RepID=UPI001F248032|nr:DUF2787 family protein [Shewanella sp. AS16]MCE9685834.1 DUF2787 domain-containing protein [Shewanella sp. AS16]
MNTINKELALPVSDKLLLALTPFISNQPHRAVTINFRDPDYSPQHGGFHPVEVRLEKQAQQWCLCYITDFCYVGQGDYWELAKEVDFDFGCGLFQSINGVFTLETATEIYQLWEQNFLCYWQELEVFEVNVSPG